MPATSLSSASPSGEQNFCRANHRIPLLQIYPNHLKSPSLIPKSLSLSKPSPSLSKPPLSSLQPINTLNTSSLTLQQSCLSRSKPLNPYLQLCPPQLLSPTYPSRLRPTHCPPSYRRNLLAHTSIDLILALSFCFYDLNS